MSPETEEQCRVVRLLPTSGSVEGHELGKLGLPGDDRPKNAAAVVIRAFMEIEIKSGRETARERAEVVRPTSNIVVCPDASGREGHLGAAVVAFDDNHKLI